MPWRHVGGVKPFLTSELDGGEWSASRLCRFIPWKEPLYPLNRGLGWAPWPVWTNLRREKSLAFTGIRTPDCPALIPLLLPLLFVSLMEGIDSIPETDLRYGGY